MASSAADGKGSGTFNRDKAEPLHVIEIPDQPWHRFVMRKELCSWTKPQSVAGTKDTTNTDFADVTGYGGAPHRERRGHVCERRQGVHA